MRALIQGVDFVVPQDPQSFLRRVGRLLWHGSSSPQPLATSSRRVAQGIPPTFRLIAPRVVPQQRNDDALGRALDTLSASGVTELSSLIAATAATRLGLTPRFAHLDSTSLHVDGRSNSDEEPEEHVMHITRG